VSPQKSTSQPVLQAELAKAKPESFSATRASDQAGSHHLQSKKSGGILLDE